MFSLRWRNQGCSQHMLLFHSLTLFLPIPRRDASQTRPSQPLVLYSGTELDPKLPVAQRFGLSTHLTSEQEFAYPNSPLPHIPLTRRVRLVKPQAFGADLMITAPIVSHWHSTVYRTLRISSLRSLNDFIKFIIILYERCYVSESERHILTPHIRFCQITCILDVWLHDRTDKLDRHLSLYPEFLFTLCYSGCIDAGLFREPMLSPPVGLHCLRIVLNRSINKTHDTSHARLASSRKKRKNITPYRSH
ncbi:hypothetical protein BD410DRAFT_601485 [Rickenella mellea]|uniref:Uncharacterized protein n=1 Tax=Rickenella mellea TaxID=50990 RepID=A0A4Y7QE49_9AGAM|nr:hypothetical protein BD410DRAFT_601485 [Rickenella mellea]